MDYADDLARSIYRKNRARGVEDRAVKVTPEVEQRAYDAKQYVFEMMPGASDPKFKTAKGPTPYDFKWWGYRVGVKFTPHRKGILCVHPRARARDIWISVTGRDFVIRGFAYHEELRSADHLTGVEFLTAELHPLIELVGGGRRDDRVSNTAVRKSRKTPMGTSARSRRQRRL